MDDQPLNDRPRDSSFADDIIDELVPEDLDWKHLVTTYPIASISVVTLAGFLLGRSHGTSLLSAVSAFMAKEMSQNILTVLDGDGPDTAAGDR